MNYLIKLYVLCLFVILNLTSCSSQDIQQLKGAMSGEHYKPLNILPMYGAPEKKKTEEQKRIDKEFIESIVKSEGSRELGAKKFAVAGWVARQKDNRRVSMMRFNQSWLLDPEYYQAYWGFGTLMLDDNNPKKAIFFLEKALSLIDEENEKSRLLVEAARAYAWEGHAIKPSNPMKAEELLNRAVSLIDEALNVDPQNGKAYYYGVQAYRSQGNYEEAWSMVRKARAVANYKFDSELIAELSKEMPEPK